ncbi:transglycosylase SLT domain-containing protein [Paraferrimonas sp. SM1919]|uniref:transglycosylase SLT domain-containing protein n=1 Tax=Paraferrimonas sp. SM1919 TaxID=2662263 RepID=UPI0013D54419|nr:transglycosylase SLT domain-containing protein [Paraferrimonas sp. SM1919]
MVKQHRLIRTLVCLGCLTLSSSGIAENSMLAEFEKSKAAIFKDFNEYKRQYAEQYQQAINGLSDTWLEPVLTSQKSWVQYSADKRMRTIVDFEHQTLVIEAIQQKGFDPKSVKKQVYQELNKLTLQTTIQSLLKDPVLGIQAKGSKDKYLFKKMLADFPVSKVAKSLLIQVNNYPDNQHLITFTGVIPKAYFEKQASIYQSEIKTYSDKWSVNPRLVHAIIQTESSFNPLAQSHIPAYGLMQIVPSSAGRDVTKFLYGKEKVLSSTELFNAEKNINYGCAYLHLLMNRYLKDVNNPDVKELLAIAAYNGGVGSVAKHFSGTKSLSALASSVNALTAEQVYTSLSQSFPYAETRNYVKKVVSRKA